MGKLEGVVPKNHPNYDLWEYLVYERPHGKRPKSRAWCREQSRKQRLSRIEQLDDDAKPY